MLRVLIPIVLLGLGVGLGAGAGYFLGRVPEQASAEASEQSNQDPEAADADQGDARAAQAPTGGAEYVRLNNQFVVPIVQHGSVRSLIVMALTVEIDAGANETVFDLEPRLRDAFLRVMFAHANAGGFDGNFTESAAMAPLRTALGEAARAVLGEIARDVLIVDITRQDA